VIANIKTSSFKAFATAHSCTGMYDETMLPSVLQKWLLSKLPLDRSYSINRTLTQTTFTFLQHVPFNFVLTVTTFPQYKTNADMEGTDW